MAGYTANYERLSAHLANSRHAFIHGEPLACTSLPCLITFLLLSLCLDDADAQVAYGLSQPGSMEEFEFLATQVRSSKSSLSRRNPDFPVIISISLCATTHGTRKQGCIRQQLTHKHTFSGLRQAFSHDGNASISRLRLGGVGARAGVPLASSVTEHRACRPRDGYW